MAARKKQPGGAGEPVPPPVLPPVQQSSHPATATQPSPIGMVLQRERLHALIDERLPGAVWLHGPTGAGKTLLLRSYLQRDGRPAIWLTAHERLADPAALFAAVTAVAAPHCTGHLPAFSPEHRDAPAAFAREYFDRIDQVLAEPFAFVVDDVHHLFGSTASLFAVAIDCFGGRRKFCFASQLMPESSFATHVAGSRLWIVGHRQLAFDQAEAGALAARLGAGRGIGAPMLDALIGATDGWAAGLMLAMQFGASGPSGGSDGSSDPLETVRTPLALLIAGQVLGGVAKEDLARLRLMAELPQVPMELADIAPDWSSACSRLQSLSERGLFVERLAAERRTADVPANRTTRIVKGCWRLHDLFRNALREPGAIGEPDIALGAALTRHLLGLERLDLAWQLASGLDAGLLAAVVASHGGVALRDVHLPAMLQMAEPHAGRSMPAIAIWHARGLIGNDNEAALRACEEAFAGYVDAGDEEGVALSVALALFVVFATIENVGRMAVWVERFVHVDRSTIGGIASGDARALRVAGEVVHDMLVGGRSNEAEPASQLQDRLMETIAAEALSANETILAGSLLVTALRRSIRLKEVETAILRVEGLVSYARSAPHIRASWNIENGFHFTRVGAIDRAKGCFEGALVVADENALLQPRVGALIGMARLALGLSDTRWAQQLVGNLESIGPERLGRQRGWVLHLRTRIEVLSGVMTHALARLDDAERLIVEAGFPNSSIVILDQDRIQILYASGDVARSIELAATVIERSSAADGRRIAAVSGLLQAHSLRTEDPVRARSLLESGLAEARSMNLMTFASLIPETAAEITGHALALGLEPAFLAQVISLRNLPAPRDAPAAWPWPLRVEVLRPFRIVTNSGPMQFTGKAQQKPLELLKFLACHREFVAESSAIAIALWPDADDGASRKSLEVTVSRLRKLLDDDSLVLVKEGKVSLDPQRVSSDAQDFLQAAMVAETLVSGRHDDSQVVAMGERLLGLFRALPLEGEELGAWREAIRERYRTTFVRAARTLIAYWKQAGDAARALALIEAALEREPLAENLYRLLMQIHLDAGNPVEAMRVYRQCRQILSVLIGAQPSVETERLKTLIRL